MESFDCTIYRSTKKADAYLFVLQNDKLENLPQALLQTLGKLEYAMDIVLTEDRKLAQNNAHQVIQSLKTQGYYLQLPRLIPAQLE